MDPNRQFPSLNSVSGYVVKIKSLYISILGLFLGCGLLFLVTVSNHVPLTFQDEILASDCNVTSINNKIKDGNGILRCNWHLEVQVDGLQYTFKDYTCRNKTYFEVGKTFKCANIRDRIYVYEELSGRIKIKWIFSSLFPALLWMLSVTSLRFFLACYFPLRKSQKLTSCARCCYCMQPLITNVIFTSNSVGYHLNCFLMESSLESYDRFHQVIEFVANQEEEQELKMILRMDNNLLVLYPHYKRVEIYSWPMTTSFLLEFLALMIYSGCLLTSLLPLTSITMQLLALALPTIVFLIYYLYLCMCSSTRIFHFDKNLIVYKKQRFEHLQIFEMNTGSTLLKTSLTHPNWLFRRVHDVFYQRITILQLFYKNSWVNVASGYAGLSLPLIEHILVQMIKSGVKGQFYEENSSIPIINDLV